ncbi:amidohydrolase family protein [Haladaptatus sp. DYF46]|uniref:amidohydrolase family protein n=1 Tax=Haladaptatus sp. DYF46 TaxID=2886041 RepID=UPI001E5A97FC|nr:amidohydrolase family protein [Haladaptatus sp. DYF46]
MREMKIIGVEGHFVSNGFVEKGAGSDPGEGGEGDSSPTDRLRDLGEGRLTEMDEGGMDVQVVSHTQLGSAEMTAEEWVELAKDANDELADAVAAHPDRFVGFATLPMADPDAAVSELERAARLDVPLYIHPGYPPQNVDATYYEGFDSDVDFSLATTSWGWHAETGLHALRLIASGAFDRHPELNVVLGHMGEMIPFMLDRIDDWLTTSGMFSRPPLAMAIRAVGVDHVMFAVDYPYSSIDDGRRLLGNAELAPADVEKLAHRNAERLLGLDAE